MANIGNGLTGAAQGLAAGNAIVPGVGGIVGGALGGLAGLFGGKGKDSAAAQAIQEEIEQLKAIGIPSIEAQKITLEKYKSAGQLTPELEQVFTQGDSELKSIQEDPALRDAQKAAIAKLQDIGNSGGLTLEDRVALSTIQNQANTDDKARQGAILSNMAERGISGSGNELAARLASSQAATNRQANQDLNVAATAQKRALDAILQGGTQAGQLRAQDFGQASTVASAQDRINQFNTQNKQQVNAANTGINNNAQQVNLTSAQNLSNKNTDLSNDQQSFNTGLIQKDYDNRINKAKAIGGLNTDAAKATQDQNATNATAFGNTLTAAGGFGRQLGEYMDSRKKAKAKPIVVAGDGSDTSNIS